MTPQDKAEQFVAIVQPAVITRYICDPGDRTVPMARPMWSIQTWKMPMQLPPVFHQTSQREKQQRHSSVGYSVRPREADDEVILQILLRDEIQ